MSGNAPAKKIRIGLISAVVWKNETDAGKPFYTVQLHRQYRDSDGNWKVGDNLNHDDILNAVRVLTRAEAWISEQ